MIPYVKIDEVIASKGKQLGYLLLGEEHVMKSSDSDKAFKILWFHAAI